MEGGLSPEKVDVERGKLAFATFGPRHFEWCQRVPTCSAFPPLELPLDGPSESASPVLRWPWARS